MRITIRKLGTIQEAEIDLKPLTVFVGPNNAGKTWLAYTLSGIFGGYGWNKYTRAYAGDELPREYPSLDNAIEKVLTEGNATIDLYKFAEDYGEKYFRKVAAFAQHWMADFMSTQFSLFDSMEILISLIEAKTEFLERVKKYSLQYKIARGLLNIRKKQDDKILYVYTSTKDEEPITKKLPDEEIRERLVRSVMEVLHQSLYPGVCVFPTERTTLVTLPFTSRVRKGDIDLSDDKTREKVEKVIEGIQELLGPNIETVFEQNTKASIVPVGYFLNMMGHIFQMSSRDVSKREKDPNFQRYIQLAQVLEQQILAGGIDFSTPEPDPRRDIFFQPTQGITLEIPIASSMIKELSPLVLYLRYLAKSGELLIIDEPEMNLHPAAQVKIIEFLAMLVNAGLHVIVTTHSTYVVDHLINLMDAHKHQNQDDIVEMFLLGRKDAFIAQDKVSVYHVEENGKVKNILDQEGIIDWETFSYVTRLVQRIHFEL